MKTDDKNQSMIELSLVTHKGHETFEIEMDSDNGHLLITETDTHIIMGVSDLASQGTMSILKEDFLVIVETC